MHRPIWAQVLLLFNWQILNRRLSHCIGCLLLLILWSKAAKKHRTSISKFQVCSLCKIKAHALWANVQNEGALCGPWFWNNCVCDPQTHTRAENTQPHITNVHTSVRMRTHINFSPKSSFQKKTEIVKKIANAMMETTRILFKGLSSVHILRNTGWGGGVPPIY